MHFSEIRLYVALFSLLLQIFLFFNLRISLTILILNSSRGVTATVDTTREALGYKEVKDLVANRYGGAGSRTQPWSPCLLPTWASQVALVVKNPPAGDFRTTGSIPGLGRSPGGEHDNPLQHSCLENSMDRGAWRATVHKVTKSWTQLSDLGRTLLPTTPFITERLSPPPQ